jgi:hypothetical protein
LRRGEARGAGSDAARRQLLVQKLAEERAHLCPPSPTAVYDDPDSRVPTLGQVVGQWASRPRREHKALDPRTVRVGFWMPLSQFRVVAERVSAKRALQGAVQTVILQRADPGALRAVGCSARLCTPLIRAQRTIWCSSRGRPRC